MSYKKKKLKKSRLSRLKYRLGQIAYAFLRKASVRLQKFISTKGQKVTMLNLAKALEILKRYDRMVRNPDLISLEQAITSQVEKEGQLNLCVFVCPKFNTKALFTSQPENYMPVDVATFGLFEDRITKIISLKKELMKAGLPTKINLVLGDNDAEEYIFPFANSFRVDTSEYKQRQQQYRVAFEEKCRTLFGEKGSVVWSLAEFGVVMDEKEPTISANNLKKEMEFFGWLFSAKGPYRGKLNFSEQVLTEMAIRKYRLYGAQGKFLEMLGGILLQTEGPGVWLERTQMLRCTGSSSIPAIYPWIRQEEIKEMMQEVR